MEEIDREKENERVKAFLLVVFLGPSKEANFSRGKWKRLEYQYGALTQTHWEENGGET